MKFSDGPTGQVDITINATPVVIWARVSDPTMPPENSNELYRAQWVEPATGPELGAQIHGWNRRGEREWQTLATVTTCEPERSFAWSVAPLDGGETFATWAFEIEPLDDTQTRVVQKVVLGPGPSGLTDAIAANPDQEERIIEGRLAFQTEAMLANLVALKRELESSPNPNRGRTESQ